ncbi:MAG: hypothetical protein AAF192_02430 [Pseudomonadota bacterium]
MSGRPGTPPGPRPGPRSRTLSGTLRNALRALAPPAARQAVRRLRKAAAGPPAFETELGAYRFAPEDGPPRLTLVIPSVAKASAFGGVTTGLDIFRRLGAALGCELRIATTDPEGPPAERARGAEDVPLVPRRGRGAELSAREKEIFIAYNWHCAANLAPLLAAQQAHYGGREDNPLVYLIQEYEPGFFPFSADHLLIRWAYELPCPTYAVVNSSLLADHMAAQGHVFARTHVFEPRLNAALKPHLAGLQQAEKRKRLLVYGRPLENRNCWPILRRGLELWAAARPDQSDWQVVSAGAAHAPLPLAGGRRARSVGKLSLDGYAAMLRESAVGVSLMASPHPSYPPLEMASFGLTTLTNRYAGKDLSRLHPNLRALPDPRPETLAETLGAACDAFAADPAAGARAAATPIPGYLDEEPYPFLPALVEDLEPFLARG